MTGLNALLPFSAGEDTAPAPEASAGDTVRRWHGPRARRPYSPGVRTLIVGHGGGRARSPLRMAEHSELYAVVGHRTPRLVRYARRRAAPTCSAMSATPRSSRVRARARDRHRDGQLRRAARGGRRRRLLAQGTRVVGPTRAASEIEWNKVFARELLREVAPEAVPRLHVVRDEAELRAAMADLRQHARRRSSPPGLTGGKGVKVMGPHLADHEAAREYALELLRARRGRRVGADRGAHRGRRVHDPGDQRRAHGRVPELDLRLPYRFDGDEGPGHRRHGVAVDGLADAAVHDARALPQACSIIDRGDRAAALVRPPLHRRHELGFFATADGVKVIEFNARFGDPECMNIMSLLDGCWTEVMQRICDGELSTPDVAAARGGLARALSRLARLRPARRAGTYEFPLDVAAIEADGCRVFFSSAVAAPATSMYRTVGTSRAVALATTAPTLEQARERLAALGVTGAHAGVAARRRRQALPRGPARRLVAPGAASRPR